MKYNIAVE